MRTMILLISLLLPSSGWSMSLAAPRQLRAMPELHLTYRQLENDLANRSGAFVLIFAHPDDELTVLPAVAHLKRLWPERAVEWILVSDAAKGMTLPGSCGFQSKSRCRYEEASRAARCAGISAPRPMNLPDGGLRTIPDLRERLWRQLERRYPGGIAAIFTHDEAGFYGHPDHLAVHDAIVPTAISREIPVITGALPDLLSEKFPIREPARSEGRRRAPITHALDFETEDYRVAVCSARAHTSQALLINSFMQFLGAERFYRNVPRTFLNLH